MASVITLKPDCVLGLATGSTPVGMYNRLAELNREGRIDFAEVKTYNLDEYYPIKPTDSQSYRYFMNKNLFDNINIDKANTHVLNGEAADADAECAAYDKAIEAAGGIDIPMYTSSAMKKRTTANKQNRGRCISVPCYFNGWFL